MITFPTLISGGSGINMVPETCEAYGDIRLMPCLSLEDVRGMIERCLAPLDISSPDPYGTPTCSRCLVAFVIATKPGWDPSVGALSLPPIPFN